MRTAIISTLIAGAAASTSLLAQIQNTTAYGVVQGNVTFYQPGDPTHAQPVQIQLNFTNIPAGLYTYHVHKYGVVSSCADASTHFDPYGVNTQSTPSTYFPYADNLTSYEVGDLAGRVGPMVVNSSNTFTGVYYDTALSMDPTNASYIGSGNRSVVVHFATNNTRFGCADIVLQFTNSASRVAGSALLMVVTGAAAALLL